MPEPERATCEHSRQLYLLLESEINVNPSFAVPVLVFSSIMWGLAWFPLKELRNSGIDGAPLTLVTYGAAGLVLMPQFLRLSYVWQSRARIMALIALFGGFANLAFAIAIIYGDVIRVMVLFYLLPAWGVIGGRVFLGEHIDTQRTVAVALALLGAFLVLGGLAAFESPPSLYDLLALAAGVTFALNNILFRLSPEVPHLSRVAAMCLGCAGMAALLVVLIPAPTAPTTATPWLWAAAFGVGWILIATLATQWAVTHMEAGRASVIIIVELITAVISAAVLAGERLAPLEIVGGACIVTSALLEAWRRPSRR